MKIATKKIIHSILLSATISLPATVSSVARADDHRRVYRDEERHDEHEWNDREEKAYRIWLKENHRKHRDFAKLGAEEQRAYWAWRHNHSDAELKIEIR
jgi:hypothetical protein